MIYPLIGIVIIQIISNTPRANWKTLKNEKCTCSSQDCICRIFYHINHLLNVSFKRKTENISILIRHVTTEKRAKSILCYKKVLVDDKNTIFHKKCLQIKDFCWQMSQFMTKRTEIIICRSPIISDACMQ